MRMGELPANASTNSVPWLRNILTDLGKALPGLATTYLSIKQQGELNKINLDRANRGEAPIEPQDYQAGVQVGVSRSTQNTIIIVAAGVAGAVLLSSVLSGRRRR